jgi:hypothetical protein
MAHENTRALQIRVWPDVVQASTAARYIGAKVGYLRKAAAAMGPGVRLTGKAGRTAAFLGKHPDPDYLDNCWWRIAEPAGKEVA